VAQPLRNTQGSSLRLPETTAFMAYRPHHMLRRYQNPLSLPIHISNPTDKKRLPMYLMYSLNAYLILQHKFFGFNFVFSDNSDDNKHIIADISCQFTKWFV
jgi:hypothetical protein